MVQLKKQFLAAVLAGAISGTAFGQVAVTPPIAPPPAPTLWSFLGVPQGFKKVKGALTNRRGNHPKAEPKAALKALNDPANLESPDAAIKRAAEIKKAEDLKPQKIKAIKYLTSIGCGCYDKDGSVTDALVAAAEDCTEDVRLATMQEIHTAATGKCCSNCGEVCCCNDKMLKKLAQVAYERDEFGCYGEPSKRVREAASAALAACCPGAVPLEILLDKPAPEKLPDPIRERDEVEDILPERERDADAEFLDAERGTSASHIRQDTSASSARLSSTSSVGRNHLDNASRIVPPRHIASSSLGAGDDQRFGPQPRNLKVYSAIRSVGSSSIDASADVPPGIAKMRNILAENTSHVSSSPNPKGGVVLAYDNTTKTAYVHFEQATQSVPLGTTLHLRPDPAVTSGFNGLWQVVESTAGCANLQPLGPEGIARVRVGDHANFGMPAVVVAPISYVR